jgi:hypothetical protein
MYFNRNSEEQHSVNNIPQKELMMACSLRRSIADQLELTKPYISPRPFPSPFHGSELWIEAMACMNDNWKTSTELIYQM